MLHCLFYQRHPTAVATMVVVDGGSSISQLEWQPERGVTHTESRAALGHECWAGCRTRNVLFPLRLRWFRRIGEIPDMLRYIQLQLASWIIYFLFSVYDVIYDVQRDMLDFADSAWLSFILYRESIDRAEIQLKSQFSQFVQWLLLTSQVITIIIIIIFSNLKLICPAHYVSLG